MDTDTAQHMALPAEGMRIETDSFGPIEVSEAHLWGAQTQRSMQHFAISTERMPQELIRALALVKRACAAANVDLGKLDLRTAQAIIES
ncbi:MAG: class II fumarate hydratase, partial [Thiomonas sp.]